MTRIAAITMLAIGASASSALAVPPVVASPYSIRSGGPGRNFVRTEPERSVLRQAELEDDARNDVSRREAAAAFADGEAAFERGDYALAADRFETAQQLSPHQWTLYNLALSRRRGGDLLGAWQAFSALAASETGGVEQREAEREREALLPLLGVVRVRGPLGARACIDAEAAVIDTRGPVDRVVLPGLHRITTAASDHDVHVEAGERIDVEATTLVAARDPVRQWLLVATAAASVATIGAIAGAATSSTRASQGLTGAAAVAGGVALGASIVALVRRSRQRASATVALRCGAS